MLVTDVIAASNPALSSAWRRRYSQTSCPCTDRKAFSPVRTLWSNEAQVDQTWVGQAQDRRDVDRLRNPVPVDEPLYLDRCVHPVIVDRTVT
jgi:hypothetical protein